MILYCQSTSLFLDPKSRCWVVTMWWWKSILEHTATRAHSSIPCRAGGCQITERARIGRGKLLIGSPPLINIGDRGTVVEAEPSVGREEDKVDMHTWHPHKYCTPLAVSTVKNQLIRTFCMNHGPHPSAYVASPCPLKQIRSLLFLSVLGFLL